MKHININSKYFLPLQITYCIEVRLELLRYRGDFVYVFCCIETKLAGRHVEQYRGEARGSSLDILSVNEAFSCLLSAY